MEFYLFFPGSWAAATLIPYVGLVPYVGTDGFVLTNSSIIFDGEEGVKVWDKVLALVHTNDLNCM